MKIYYLLFFLQIFISSCEDEPILATQSIDGTWQVIDIRINSEMKRLSSPATNASYIAVEITIPNAISGNVSGNTFQNTIWFEYELKEENKVTFANYGGTRAAEDEWGIAFSENILLVSHFSIENDTLYFKNERELDIISLIKKTEQ